MDDVSLAGKRVLIVEDEFIIALELEDQLAARGLAIVGPISRVSQALAVVNSESIDCAILDVNLAGERSYPIAEALEERGIPFVLMTGYGEHCLPQERTWEAIPKPVSSEVLFEMLSRKLRMPS